MVLLFQRSKTAILILPFFACSSLDHQIDAPCSTGICGQFVRQYFDGFRNENGIRSVSLIHAIGLEHMLRTLIVIGEEDAAKKS